jgi:uncharacterized protein (TIGR02594 family)
VRVLIIILFFTLLTNCAGTVNPVSVAESKIGLNEYQHKTVLKEYVGFDPRYTEWCAAFVNAVLAESIMTNLHDMDHPRPLNARSFLDWGEEVDVPRAGDIIVFPRGKSDWQGHVGFYVGTTEKNGKKYYRILGGNQNDSVSIDLYSANQALGIRRYKYLYGPSNT